MSGNQGSASNGSPVKGFPCPDCTLVAKSKGALASHRRWKHPVPPSVSSDELEGAVGGVPVLTPQTDGQNQGQNPVSGASGLVIGSTATGTVKGFACPNCPRSFDKSSGLSLHRRKAHASIFHAEFVPPVLTKARWCTTELTLVAREEIRLSRIAGKRATVAAIAACFPDRTFDSLKSLRRNPEYQRILSEVEERLIDDPCRTGPEDGSSQSLVSPPNVTTQARESDVGVRTPGPLSPATMTNSLADSLLSGEGASVCSAPCEQMNTLLIVLKANRQKFHLDDHSMDSLASDLATGLRSSNPALLQSLIDTEYDGWLTYLDKTYGPFKKPTLSKPGGRWIPPKIDSNCRSSKKLERRRQYREVQRLFKKNRSRCADLVLSGDWSKEPVEIPFEEQESFWGPLFETQSLPDRRRPDPISPPILELVDPISATEYSDSLKSLKDGSPGVDGMDRAYLRGIDAEDCIAHFQLWLATRTPPLAFKAGITSLIPKSADSNSPGQFRPITVSAIISRLFHRILASRLESLVPLSPRQKAFRRGDGLQDNVMILRSLIKDRCNKNRPVSLAFIDVAKAFDSVSHESLILAAERVGVPSILLDYCRNLYCGGTTSLKYGRSQSSRVISARRGVRQGDPLSPILFNFLMDWVLSALDDNLGLAINDNTRVCHLAFADDLVLLSESVDGLRTLARDFEIGLSNVGLLPNAKKSATMRILVSGKRKKWVIDPKPFLSLGGVEVPTIGIDGYYKYLGLSMTAGKPHARASDRLLDHLSQLDRAPLKPQQRMYFLKVHVLPGLNHLLVLDPVTVSQLQRLDIAVRRHVRKWLRLPHDSPNSFIHASVSDGGLGVSSLRTNIPLLKRDRIDRLISRVSTGLDPVLEAVYKTSRFLNDEIRRWSQPRSFTGRLIATKEDARNVQASSLHTSVDGRGLRFHNLVPSSNDWLTNTTSVQSGNSFIHCVQMRAASLHCAVRAARGRPGASMKCDACGELEGLSHIVQRCCRTARPRDGRHDSVVQFLAKKLLGPCEVLVEPTIPTPSGIKRPDLVVFVPGQWAKVIDVSIVSDDIHPDIAHQRKADYYSREPAVVAWVAFRTDCLVSSIDFAGAIWNWRGALSPASATVLADIGIRKSDLNILTIRVLEQGFKCWRTFKDCTWLGGRRRRRRALSG